LSVAELYCGHWPFRNALSRFEGSNPLKPVCTQELTADRVLDITAETCPMTFVRTRLALDRLTAGATLLVRLRGDEPRANVPRTAAEQGHAVLATRELPDGSMEVLLRKGA
jgi:tRNA 2-thiouridine synthesizing protein A